MAPKRRVVLMGTRGSALAQAQAGQVAQKLQSLDPELEIKTVLIETSGDRFALSNPHAAASLESSDGVKGLFVKEIEQALLGGRIDFAVHSAKDLPAQTAAGLAIAAYPEREDPRDVFIAKSGIAWPHLPPQAKIGTSSLRRKMQILALKPDAAVAPLRGNIDTRLKKLTQDSLDGIILAAAGLRRLGKNEPSAIAISPDLIVPAPGQGALALEIRAADAGMVELLKPLDHPRTRLETECERAFSAAAGGGCSSPVGALAQAQGAALTLRIFWASSETSAAKRLRLQCADAKNWRQFALDAAAAVRA